MCSGKKGRKKTVYDTRHCKLKWTINSDVVFCFLRIASLCNWSRKFRQWLTSFSQSIRCKTQSNRMVALVIPCMCLFVVLRVLFDLWDWNGPFSLLWFWFYDIRSLSALLFKHLMTNKMTVQTLARMNLTNKSRTIRTLHRGYMNIWLWLDEKRTFLNLPDKEA